MVKTASMRTAVADPVVLVLLLLLGGLGLASFRHRFWHRFWRRLGGVLLVLGVAALYLLAIPLVSERLLQLAEVPPHTPPPALAAAPEAIVILGGGAYQRPPEYEGDTVDALTLERVRYGARLQRETGLPILVTGAGPRDISVAESMRQALIEDFGVPVRWVEGDARTTYENAVNSAAILRGEGLGTIYLVTHAEHMRRAQAAFVRAGLAVVPAATAFTSPDPEVSLRHFVPRATTLAGSARALREFVGRVWYRLAYAAAG